MINQDLINFFKEGVSSGCDISALKEKALASGYSEPEIRDVIISLEGVQNKVLARVDNTQEAKTENKNENIGFWKKMGWTIGSPRKLFNSVENEGIWKNIKYFFGLIAVSFALVFLLFLFFIQFVISRLDVSSSIMTIGILQSSIVFAVILVFLTISMVIGSFSSAGVYYFFMKILGGNGSYAKTHTGIIYSMSPFLLFSCLPIFWPVLFIWSCILRIYALSKYHNVPKWKAVFLIFIFIAIGILALALFVFNMIDFFSNFMGP